MASGAVSSQSGSAWLGRLAGRPLAQEHDVGDDRGAFALEGVGGQADRSQEIRPLGEVLADGGVLLVEREMAGDQGQDAAGLQGVNGLGEEEIVQGELLAAVVELDVGERHVADHRVDRSGSCVSRKFSMRMSARGAARGRCGRRWQSSSTPMKRMPCGAMAHEIARCRSPAPAPWRCRARRGGQAPRAWPR